MKAIAINSLSVKNLDLTPEREQKNTIVLSQEITKLAQILNQNNSLQSLWEIFTKVRHFSPRKTKLLSQFDRTGIIDSSWRSPQPQFKQILIENTDY